MKMEMLDALPRRSSAVGDDAEAVLEAELLGETCYYLEDMSHYGGVFGVYLGTGADVLSRDDEKMTRSLRVNVIEGINEIV